MAKRSMTELRIGDKVAFMSENKKERVYSIVKFCDGWTLVRYKNLYFTSFLNVDFVLTGLVGKVGA